MIASQTLSIPAPMSRKGQYPLAFWCFVLFSFIVFVAPQNVYPSLQPLHLARVSFLLALGVYVFQAFIRREALLPTGREVRLLAIFVFIAALSIPFSMWSGGSADLLMDHFAKSLLVCLLSIQLLTTTTRLRRLLWFTILFGIVDALIAIVKYQQGEFVEGYRTPGAVAGLVSNPNDLALLLNLLIPFALAFHNLERSAVRKMICLAFVGLAFVAILLAFSRGGIITLSTIMIVYAWKMMARGQRLKFIMPAVLFAMAFMFLAPSDYDDRLQSITDFSKDKTGSAPLRWENTLQTLQVMSEHPLLGVGLGMNILALNDKGSRWHQVHNVYLQIASEIGIPGVIVFVMLLLALIKVARQMQRLPAKADASPERREVAMLAMATEVSLLGFCVAALFHPVAYHFYFYYLAGFALALKGIALHLPESSRQEEGEIVPYARMQRAWRHG